MKLSLFKKTQHKQFNHIPIYYNEREERIKEMEENAHVDQSTKKDRDYHETLKGSMRRYNHQHQSGVHFAQSEKRRSNIRIAVILIILFLLAYLLWNHTETFVEAFIKR